MCITILVLADKNLSDEFAGPEESSKAMIELRGSNEMYNHRMEDEHIQSLSAELNPSHDFITWGVDCSVNSKKFKVCFTVKQAVPLE